MATLLSKNVSVMCPPRGGLLLLSYGTPVAGLLTFGSFFRTSKKWSRSTDRHIKQFLGQHYEKARVLPQETIDEFVTSLD